MSPNQQFIYQSQQQDEKIIPLHHHQHLENTKSRDKIDRELLVSWLFFVGSIMFTFDAILENVKGVSFSSLLHISASILFTLGSVLFIPSNQQK
ncbi:hypothetical protein [Gloeocapsopsis sp. IPPAS B-1203]|uniref:hypothetical protein n=1 Tax=Gloeocapsopsis sp. IPPAS B-1203 TaxID=2049454 RepID=UPI000C19B5B1|nr:hypothetical protein [Gloeocapsopsis sp. IPPAS B-1203]PIG90989.1 hypothetical protein CSQ79_23435 [Gloeocapsopsis sp. IPPAS B-1203]